MDTVSIHRWPDDFVELDHGALFVRRDVVPCFTYRRWTRAASVLDSSDFEIIRRRNDRENSSIELPVGTGGLPRRVFVKRYTERKHGDCPGLLEARAVGSCQSAGIPCMDVVAAGRRASGTPHGGFDSFFMSEQVGNGESAYQRAFALKADPSRESQAAFQDLIRAVAVTAARLHASDLYHQDCSWKHFLLDGDGGRECRVRLIDLNGLRRASRPARYAWIKDLEQLRHSMAQIGLSGDELRFWQRCYFATLHSLGRDVEFPRLLHAGITVKGLSRAGKRLLRRKRRPAAAYVRLTEPRADLATRGSRLVGPGDFCKDSAPFAAGPASLRSSESF